MTQDLSKEPVNAVVEADLDTMTATKETLEDYTLRFAPRSYRKWSTGVVAVSALGGIAYLADFAIGANIGISYGTTNALWGIAIFAVVIFATGLPLAYYAARYNIDLDLITRGSGFGYYGSVVTNVIFASFTFIFFALEGSIMAQGLELGLGVPLWLGYAASTLIIFPLVIYGMKVLTTLQVWTTPLWLVLMVIPFVYLVVANGAAVANEPVSQFLEIYEGFMPTWLALTLAVVLVVISQVKINVTNAYSGSLAWTNSYTRLTKHYPGRLVFLAFNLLIALVLMEANMFSFLNTILGFYANLGMAWVVAVASDITFNKYVF